MFVHNKEMITKVKAIYTTALMSLVLVVQQANLLKLFDDYLKTTLYVAYENEQSMDWIHIYLLGLIFDFCLLYTSLFNSKMCPCVCL